MFRSVARGTRLAESHAPEVPMRFFFVASLLATAAGCATVADQPARSAQDPAFARRATAYATQPQPKPIDDPHSNPTPPEGFARLDNSH